MAKKKGVVVEEETIKEFLERGVENVYPNLGALEGALESGKKLRAYLGIDPTGPTLHMGHVIPLKKLRDLQQMGHEVILLIGDFTAMIGDPTDKTAARVRQTREQVLDNCKLYKDQASKFLSFTGPNPAKLMFNSAWLGKMTFSDVVELAAHFTVQQMSERDMFEKRMRGTVVCGNCGTEIILPKPTYTFTDKNTGRQAWQWENPQLICPKCKKEIPPEIHGDKGWRDFVPPRPVYLHEFLYPLMQGYDSVAMDVDIEVGGNDQTFNMLAGRTLLKEIKHKEKYVLATTLLEDDAGKKMGKTEGNMLALIDSAEDMYGKVMSWTDGMILPGFRLCTDVEPGEIERIEDLMKKGGNPVEFKHRLAKEIVKFLKSPEDADAARDQFNRVHKSHEAPVEMPTLKIKKSASLVDVLVDAKLVTSKTDARHQIEQGGVKVDGRVVKDTNIIVRPGSIIQKGKRHFVKLV
jgi:tyrosyl-tRNA synthetase